MTPLRRIALLLLVLPALSLAGCGGAGSDAAGSGTGSSGGTVAAQGAPDSQAATVAATPKLAFAPNTVTAKPGTVRLTMRIEGKVPHNLVFGDAGLGRDVPVISSGEATGTFVFPKAGTYDFTCTLHPGMDGRVVVA